MPPPQIRSTAPKVSNIKDSATYQTRPPQMEPPQVDRTSSSNDDRYSIEARDKQKYKKVAVIVAVALMVFSAGYSSVSEFSFFEVFGASLGWLVTFLLAGVGVAGVFSGRLFGTDSRGDEGDGGGDGG